MQPSHYALCRLVQPGDVDDPIPKAATPLECPAHDTTGVRNRDSHESNSGALRCKKRGQSSEHGLLRCRIESPEQLHDPGHIDGP